MYRECVAHHLPTNINHLSLNFTVCTSDDDDDAEEEAQRKQRRFSLEADLNAKRSHVWV